MAARGVLLGLSQDQLDIVTVVSPRAAAGGSPPEPGLRLWTTDEDALLVELRKTYQWSVVAEKLGTGRSQSCCKQRFYHLSGTGRAAPAQSALGGALLSGVPPGESPAAGEKKTSVSPRAAAGGSPSCLESGFRVWTADEDALLVELRKTHQWSVVAEKLGTGRSQNCCTQRFYRLSGTDRAAPPQTGIEWSSTLRRRAEELARQLASTQTSATRRGPAASAPGGDDRAGVRADAAVCARVGALCDAFGRSMDAHTLRCRDMRCCTRIALGREFNLDLTTLAISTVIVADASGVDVKKVASAAKQLVHAFRPMKHLRPVLQLTKGLLIGELPCGEVATDVHFADLLPPPPPAVLPPERGGEKGVDTPPRASKQKRAHTTEQ